MPEFSLIVATKERTAELARLIASIDRQSGPDFELIVVDQNEDARLEAILAASEHRERIRHLRCKAGVSLARNLGMEQAKGRIIGFPDDDCWYPPDTLRNLSEWFRGNPAYDMLTVNSLDENGIRSANRWFQDSCDLSRLNIYRTSVGYTIFIRGDGNASPVRYDESSGPGANTPYLGGEDTDFVLAAMERGARGRFEAKWHIGHPLKDIRNATVSRDRAYIYGRGMGFVQRKHGLWWLSAGLAAFDFARAICAYAVGRRTSARLWYRHGRGIVDGFFAPQPKTGLSASHY
jgi:glycosyltransferase involved in cell wall biosynthesis